MDWIRIHVNDTVTSLAKTRHYNGSMGGKGGEVCNRERQTTAAAGEYIFDWRLVPRQGLTLSASIGSWFGHTGDSNREERIIEAVMVCVLLVESALCWVGFVSSFLLLCP